MMRGIQHDEIPSDEVACCVAVILIRRPNTFPVRVYNDDTECTFPAPVYEDV